MTHPAPIPETPTAASAAEALAGDMEALTELRVLGLGLARTIQSLGVKAGDLDRAGVATTHFDRLSLGIRRVIALRAWLLERQQRERDQAEHRRDRRRAEIDHRRRSVAQGVSRAIAAVKPDAAGPDPRRPAAADRGARRGLGTRRRRHLDRPGQRMDRSRQLEFEPERARRHRDIHR